MTMLVGGRCAGAVPANPDSLFKGVRPRFVIPAKAGIHFAKSFAARGFWIPASAGMTESLSGFCPVSEMGTRPRCLFQKTWRGILAARVG